MPDYRRWRVAGGTYFFTVKLLNRKLGLLVEHIDLLREAVRKVKAMQPFEIDAMVILPGHLYAVWTLPTSTATITASPKGSTASRSDPRRTGVRAACGIYALQPAQTWLGEAVADWPHSTSHRYVTALRYINREWRGNEVSEVEKFGEWFAAHEMHNASYSISRFVGMSK